MLLPTPKYVIMFDIISYNIKHFLYIQIIGLSGNPKLTTTTVFTVYNIVIVKCKDKCNTFVFTFVFTYIIC